MVRSTDRRMIYAVIVLIGSALACTLPEAFPSLAYPTASLLSEAMTPAPVMSEPTPDPQNLPVGELFSSAPAQPLTIGTAEEARIAFEEGARFLNQFTGFSPETEIEAGVFSREATIAIDEYDRMLLPNNWCAINAEVLRQNLAGMRLDFEVDGRLATEENIYTYDYTGGDGWACIGRLILLKDFSPGEHQLIRRVQIDQPLNDGETDYLPSLRIDRIRIQVKSPEQLTAERASCADSIGNALFKNLEGMRVVFCDTFDANTGWWLDNFDGEMMISNWTIADGSLRVENTEKETEKGFHYQVFPLISQDFTDFAASIEGDRLEGTRSSAYGLLFRMRPDGKGFYYFYLLDGKPSYGIDLFLEGEWSSIQQTTISEVIHLNGRNQLAVIAEGERITCYINGVQVRSFEDNQLLRGGLGLGFSLAQPSASAVFQMDNFLVFAR